MTVKTRDEINSEIDTLLPDNTSQEISPADLRAPLKDLADSAKFAADLATVATSGAYGDLMGKPALATVATSGAYGDLMGKPALGSAAALTAGEAAGNVPVLDADGKIADAVLPSYVGAVLTGVSFAINAAITATDTVLSAVGKLQRQITDLSSSVTGILGWARREVLTANRTYYVRTDGSNSNSGLANTSGGAFLTIQKAINTVTDTLDLGGFSVTIQVGAGTYASGVLMTRPAVGGVLKISGDTTTPANVALSMAGGCITASGASVKLSVEGLKVASSGADGLLAADCGQIAVSGKMDYGACAGAHNHTKYGGIIDVSGISYNITAAATFHFWTETFGACIRAIGAATVTITGSPTFTVFVQSQIGSGIVGLGATYSGTVTGKRYNADSNAVIYTAGSGASYFPGTVAGTTATGGQYV
ncbi:hypothetical protein [Mesorhizobium sp. INR15]|uniref:hypothetical protein n=1 Tax=Mesorhizobium sp. INR15 TaxID=2654248 RepID=UPI0018964EAC|nr:hypothetical protein [Mesorhizobium sp. INR15]QPC91461.1 hypothetical protein GA829_13040 [Mesorhizobium sp. INR15]